MANPEEDVVGRVYEYFLGKFAAAEGKGGEEFYTPKCVVNLIAEMIEPFKGKIYDPCCGSGGMFVQSIKFVQSQGNQKDISIYGQVPNVTSLLSGSGSQALRMGTANTARRKGLASAGTASALKVILPQNSGHQVRPT